MKRERWLVVRKVLAEAFELPADARESFVRERCGGDPDLCAEVLRLVRVGPPGPDFLQPPGEVPEPFEAGGRLGDFELIEEIGRGGMGVVYRARQGSLDREVALKLLPPGPLLTERARQRFDREAHAVARLSHPNIVPVLVVGEERGVRYFAMEYVRGSNLALELQRLRQQARPTDGSSAHLPDSRAEAYFRTVAELVRQAADGLDHAHRHGVVHRDVKPSNLLVDESGRLHIVDFGLARDETRGSITRTGDLAGTPHYMSPEQARAIRADVDHRTDVYSLGVVLYELLTLRRPFEGHTSQEVIGHILSDEPTPIRRHNTRVPRDLATICAVAMAKRRDDRYATAKALRDDLGRFLAHQAIEAHPPGLGQRLARWSWRHRLALIVAVTVAGAAWAGVALAEGRARARANAADLSVLEDARDESLEELPLARSLDLRRRLADLHARGAGGDPRVRAFDDAFAGHAQALLDGGLEHVRRARDRSLSAGARETERLLALQTFLRAAYLFPEDERFRELGRIDAAYPTLAVRARDPEGRPVEGEVRLRPVDPLTSGVGDARVLGRLPLGPVPVEPGFYRVVVVADSGAFAEAPCAPSGEALDARLDLVVRDAEDVRSGMVRFEATRFTFPDYPGEPCFQGETVALEAFLVDEAEVSNEEYAAFVAATGRELPVYWRELDDLDGFLAEHGALPVVGVTWDDAVAFATHAGKRLPTAAEWHVAAGGPEARPWPWGAAPGGAARGNVFAPVEHVAGGRDLALYLERAAPVRSHPEARSVEGLYHVYGNVDELTESVAVVVRAEGDERAPLASHRFVQGGWWDAVARGHDPRTPGFVGRGALDASWHTGFRCAKSANP